MSKPERIRRILVALDASPHSLAALQAAAELAAELGTELVGVFVEDVNLVRLAALPVTREIGHTSARIRGLDEATMTRQLRGLAQRAERALAGEAGRLQVRWSFRVSRGTIGAELWGAASEADLVVMGRTGWSAQRRAGSSVEAVLASGMRRTLVIGTGAGLQPTLLVVHDGSEMGDRALTTATLLAKSKGGYLTVAISRPDPEQAQRLQRQVAEQLRPQGLEVRYRWLHRSDSRALAELVASEQRCVLVLPAEAPQLHDLPLPEILENLNCPVLIVR
ncbi:MAG: universal stress protein [Chloroflexi bacterium]|nr:universal stress protein [Chloroflexota bacterium]